MNLKDYQDLIEDYKDLVLIASRKNDKYVSLDDALNQI